MDEIDSETSEPRKASEAVERHDASEAAESRGASETPAGERRSTSEATTAASHSEREATAGEWPGGRPSALPPGEIVLSTAGETVTVTVAGTIDVRLVVALRKVLLEAGNLAPATLRLHLLISVDGAELVARIVRETQARLLSARPRFLVATHDPAVLRLLRGARISAELQSAPG